MYAPASDIKPPRTIVDKLFEAVRFAVTSGASGLYLAGGYAGSMLQDESDGTRPQGCLHQYSRAIITVVNVSLRHGAVRVNHRQDVGR